jgi:branched-chain amino acid transport system permease protein
MTALDASPPRVRLGAGAIAGLGFLGLVAVVGVANAAGLIDRSGLVYKILIDPFAQMAGAPDLLLQTLWEGLVSGVLYALIALGFVLIFKASGVFNFAQGIMVVFAGLTLVGTFEWLTGLGLPKGPVAAYLALAVALAVMFVLAIAIERLVLRPLVNQPDIILFMATFGITYFLIGFGEFVFGGNPKQMIAEDLGLPRGALQIKFAGGFVSLQYIDIAAALIAAVMIGLLAFFFQKTRIGRALRAVADSHKAALSVGISLDQIWVIVWFTAGVVALVAGIMWGARSDVSFALQIVALKALPVLILGGFTSVPGAIVGGLVIGVTEKLGEFYWGPLVGGGIESWLAYAVALAVLLVRPQGLFGEKIIERI